MTLKSKKTKNKKFLTKAQTYDRLLSQLGGTGIECQIYRDFSGFSRPQETKIEISFPEGCDGVAYDVFDMLTQPELFIGKQSSKRKK